MSVDKNERHRGSDAGDAPLLGDGEVAPGKGDVVIGGKEGDQAEGKATDGLGDTESVKAKGAQTEWAEASLGGLRILVVCRIRRRLAASG